jgi:hypothetical protein
MYEYEYEYLSQTSMSMSTYLKQVQVLVSDDYE